MANGTLSILASVWLVGWPQPVGPSIKSRTVGLDGFPWTGIAALLAGLNALVMVVDRDGERALAVSWPMT